ncbi:MAG TPA: hypothetical protein VH542_08715, partial [Steroidobacteraceae bacterium]
MIERRADSLEKRLLVLAPIGRDAALIEALLGPDVVCANCPDLDRLSQELERGAAAMLLTEEVLVQDQT